MLEEFKIEKYDERFRTNLIQVWENSVGATHKFLDPKDIDYFKGIVEQIDFRTLSLFCLNVNSNFAGFIGVLDKKVEMLFLDPKYTNKGFGKKLMAFVIEELGVNKVDVNEQNIEAVKFYKKLGFETYDRTEKDSSGKDYPILLMKMND